MVSFNIKEISVRQAVTSFIIKNYLKGTGVSRYCIETSDSRQDDGTNLIVTLDEGEHEFSYEGVKMSYNILKGETPISGTAPSSRTATVSDFCANKTSRAANMLVVAMPDDDS